MPDPELAAQRMAAQEEAKQLVGRGDELDYVARRWNLISNRDFSLRNDSARNPLWRLRAWSDRNAVAVIGPSRSGKSVLLAKAALDLGFQDVARGLVIGRTIVRAGLTAA